MLKTVAAFDRIGEENAFAVLARATKLASEGMDVINLGIGQPDFKTPQHIVEAAVKALRDGHHGYTPANGILPCREAVARRTLTTTGIEISPESVMIMPGGKPTMYAAIVMFGEPGAEIMYPDPGFPIYRSMIEYTGAKPVPVPIREENGFGFSAEETLALINEKTRLIIINSPANPTGGVTSRDEIVKLVKGLEKWPDVAIMSDEIYDVMTYDGEKHTSLLQFPEIRDRLIVLNGWSKTWAMTGWRLGWSIWPDQLIDKVRKLAVNCWSCVNAPSQFAGIAAIDGPQDDVAAANLSSNWPTVFRVSPAKRRRVPSMRFPTSRKPVGRPRNWRRRFWRNPVWPPSAVRTSEFWAKAISAFPMRTRKRTSPGRWSGSASFSGKTRSSRFPGFPHAVPGPRFSTRPGRRNCVLSRAGKCTALLTGASASA